MTNYIATKTVTGEAHACPVCVVDAALSRLLEGADKRVLTQRAITRKFDQVISTTEHLVRVLKQWKLDMRNSKSERIRRQVVRGSVLGVLDDLPFLLAEKPIQKRELAQSARVARER